MDEQILKDFLATAKKDNYNWEIIFPKFPELEGIDQQLLKDYAATAKKYNYDYSVINSKFPELFGEQQTPDLKKKQEDEQPDTTELPSEDGSLEQSKDQEKDSKEDYYEYSRNLFKQGYNTKKARGLRKVARDNTLLPDYKEGDGEESTVKFAYAQTGDTYSVYPTLFPKDPNNYTYDPEDWMEPEGFNALDVASERGEVFEFDNEQEAKEFAEGSWKTNKYLEKALVDPMEADNSAYLLAHGEDSFLGKLGMAIEYGKKFNLKGEKANPAQKYIFEAIEDFTRAVSTGKAGADEVSAARDIFIKGDGMSDEDFDKLVKAAEDYERIGESEAMKQFQSAEYAGGDLEDYLNALVKNPRIAGEVSISTIATMIGDPSIIPAAAAVGMSAATPFLESGPVAAAIGIRAAMAFVNGYTEGLSIFAQKLREELGPNATAEDAKELLKDPERASILRAKAIAGGATVLAMDYIFGKLGGKAAGKIGRRTAAKRIKGQVATTATEVVGGSVGEAAKEFVIGDEFQTGEILLEGLAELPMAGPALVASGFDRPTFKMKGVTVPIEDIENAIQNLSVEELAAFGMELEIEGNGAEEYKELFRDARIEASIRDDLKTAYPDLEGEALERAVELEKQAKKLEGRNTRSASKKAEQIRGELDVILEEAEITAEEKTKEAAPVETEETTPAAPEETAPAAEEKTEETTPAAEEKTEEAAPAIEEEKVEPKQEEEKPKRKKPKRLTGTIDEQIGELENDLKISEEKGDKRQSANIKRRITNLKKKKAAAEEESQLQIEFKEGEEKKPPKKGGRRRKKKGATYRSKGKNVPVPTELQDAVEAYKEIEDTDDFKSRDGDAVRKHRKLFAEARKIALKLGLSENEIVDATIAASREYASKRKTQKKKPKTKLTLIQQIEKLEKNVRSVVLKIESMERRRKKMVADKKDTKKIDAAIKRQKTLMEKYSQERDALIVDRAKRRKQEGVSEEERQQIDELFQMLEKLGISVSDKKLGSKTVAARKIVTNVIRRQAQKALKVLSKTLPDVKIVIHETPEAFAEAMRKEHPDATEEDKQNDFNSSGEYVHKSRTIHINIQRADTTTVGHEVFHAFLIDAVGPNSAALALEAANMMGAVEKLGRADINAALETFIKEGKYDENLTNEEKLSQLLGILSASYTKLSIPEKTLVRQFIDAVINAIGKVFGYAPRKEFTKKDEDVINFLNNMAEALASGDVFEGDALTESFSVADDTSDSQRRRQVSFEDAVKENQRRAAPMVMGRQEEDSDAMELTDEELPLERRMQVSPEEEMEGLNLSPVSLTQKPMGAPITQQEGQGICDGTCSLMVDRLIEAGLPYGRATIPDIRANFHVVALTEIDDEVYIVDQPQKEIISDDVMDMPSYEVAEYWTNSGKTKFNRHFPKDMNMIMNAFGGDAYEAILCVHQDEEFGKFGPYFDLVSREQLDRKGPDGEEIDLITATSKEDPSVSVRMEVERGVEESELDSLSIVEMESYKEGERVPVWQSTEFKPRVMKASKETLMQEYGLTEREAEMGMASIGISDIMPAWAERRRQVNAEIEWRKNKDLNTTGSYGNYLKYLRQIFPNSIAKEAYFRGTYTAKEAKERGAFAGFESKGLFFGYPKGGFLNYPRGKFFTLDEKYAKTYGPVVSAMLDIRNPYTDMTRGIADMPDYIIEGTYLQKVEGKLTKVEGDLENRVVSPKYIKKYLPSYDAVMGTDIGQVVPEHMDPTAAVAVVFNSKQVHILGTEKDVDGFKNFMSRRRQTFKDQEKFFNSLRKQSEARNKSAEEYEAKLQKEREEEMKAAIRQGRDAFIKYQSEQIKRYKKQYGSISDDAEIFPLAHSSFSLKVYGDFETEAADFFSDRTTPSELTQLEIENEREQLQEFYYYSDFIDGDYLTEEERLIEEQYNDVSRRRQNFFAHRDALNNDNIVTKGTIIMPIGISGSGKSTWVKTLPKDFVVVSPDDIRRELTGNVSDQSKNREVFQEVDKRIEKLLEQNKKVVLDATNVNTKLRKEFMEKILKDFPDTTFTYKLFPTNPELSKKRISQDIALGVDRADVPASVVDRQNDMFIESLKSIDSEKFSNNLFRGEQEGQINEANSYKLLGMDVPIDSDVSKTDRRKQNLVGVVGLSRFYGNKYVGQKTTALKMLKQAKLLYGQAKKLPPKKMLEAEKKILLQTGWQFVRSEGEWMYSIDPYSFQLQAVKKYVDLVINLANAHRRYEMFAEQAVLGTGPANIQDLLTGAQNEINRAKKELGSMRASDLFAKNHPMLDMYPELRSLELTYEHNEGGFAAYRRIKRQRYVGTSYLKGRAKSRKALHHYGGHEIVLYKNSLNGIFNTSGKQYQDFILHVESSVTHEIQHMVQAIEGFSQGSSNEDIGLLLRLSAKLRRAAFEKLSNNISSAIDIAQTEIATIKYIANWIEQSVNMVGRNNNFDSFFWEEFAEVFMNRTQSASQGAKALAMIQQMNQEILNDMNADRRDFQLDGKLRQGVSEEMLPMRNIGYINLSNMLEVFFDKFGSNNLSAALVDAETQQDGDILLDAVVYDADFASSVLIASLSNDLAKLMFYRRVADNAKKSKKWLERSIAKDKYQDMVEFAKSLANEKSSVKTTLENHEILKTIEEIQFLPYSLTVGEGIARVSQFRKRVGRKVKNPNRGVLGSLPVDIDKRLVLIEEYLVGEPGAMNDFHLKELSKSFGVTIKPSDLIVLHGPSHSFPTTKTVFAAPAPKEMAKDALEVSPTTQRRRQNYIGLEGVKTLSKTNPSFGVDVMNSYYEAVRMLDAAESVAKDLVGMSDTPSLDILQKTGWQKGRDGMWRYALNPYKIDTKWLKEFKGQLGGAIKILVALEEEAKTGKDFGEVFDSIDLAKVYTGRNVDVLNKMILDRGKDDSLSKYLTEPGYLIKKLLGEDNPLFDAYPYLATIPIRISFGYTPNFKGTAQDLQMKMLYKPGTPEFNDMVEDREIFYDHKTYNEEIFENRYPVQYNQKEHEFIIRFQSFRNQAKEESPRAAYDEVELAAYMSAAIQRFIQDFEGFSMFEYKSSLDTNIFEDDDVTRMVDFKSDNPRPVP